jgi:hypothetical protein
MIHTVFPFRELIHAALGSAGLVAVLIMVL